MTDIKNVLKLDSQNLRLAQKLRLIFWRLAFAFSLVFSLLFSAVFYSENVQADILFSPQLSSLSFISQDYTNTEVKQFGFVGFNLKSIKAQDDIFKINFETQIALNNTQLSFYNPREIFWTYKLDSSNHFHFGRRLKAWSEADQKWNLSLFQPQMRWNPLDVENQGLTGLFYESKIFDSQSDKILLSLFVSGFYIPDQGPSYEVKNGEFSSTNPYFSPPPQNINFQGVDLPIDYNIIKPSTADVVFQPQFATQFKYISEEGFQTTLSLAYKPSSQLALAYGGVLVTDRVRIDVTPKTYYETLIGTDILYKASKNDSSMLKNLGLSVIHSRPEQPEFEENLNSPVISESTVFSPFIQFNFDSIQNNLSLDFSALFITGEELSETGPQADPNRLPLTTKYLYKNASQIKLSYQDLITDDINLISSLSYRQSHDNALQVISFKNTIDISGPLKFNIDVLLAETNEEITPTSTFRNLDQLWLGVSYDL